MFGQWGVGCKGQRRIQESSIFPSLEFPCSQKRQSVFLSFVEMSKALRTGSIIMSSKEDRDLTLYTHALTHRACCIHALHMYIILKKTLTEAARSLSGPYTV